MSKLAKIKVEGNIVVERCKVARDFFSRFLGLMGRSSIAADEAVFFPRCNSVHTFFMRFPIDVVFLNGENQVVEVVEAMKSWRLLLPRSGVKHTLELAAHRSKVLGITPGKTLQWIEGQA